LRNVEVAPSRAAAFDTVIDPSASETTVAALNGLLKLLAREGGQRGIIQ
jgi:hypothetical protein